ncbi:hypothetical protein K474DRAFT_800141 [Panus rudis PR-1116 ss-1]|nr:hypothetical protein K474DRAFT_800141 [Panus rudis PR-1116 ss-1]
MFDKRELRQVAQNCSNAVCCSGSCVGKWALAMVVSAAAVTARGITLKNRSKVFFCESASHKFPTIRGTFDRVQTKRHPHRQPQRYNMTRRDTLIRYALLHNGMQGDMQVSCRYNADVSKQPRFTFNLWIVKRLFENIFVTRAWKGDRRVHTDDNCDGFMHIQSHEVVLSSTIDPPGLN